VTLVAFAVSHDDDDARRIENTHRMKFRFLPQRQGHSYAHGESLFTVEGLHTLVQAAGALAASGHPARG